MVSTQRKQSEFNIFLLIFAFVCLILFWTSRNSYTHDIFTNIDNAWYFTCGKSWMLGLQPYLDFADSKGPLLWLIYGIGYLVSPQSYIGVFWLECLFSATTLFFMYKTAKCLSGKTCLSLAATLASSLFLYNALHFETKAEDFSLPFIAASLFVTVREFYGNRQRPATAAFTVGLSIAACLLIKYSHAVMCAGFAVALLVHNFSQTTGNRWKTPAALICGFLLMAAPFAVYFIATGLWDNFIQEYFINTMRTVSLPPKETLSTYFLQELPLAFSFRKLTYTLVILGLLVGSFLMSVRMPRHRWMLPALVLWFVLLSLRHNITGHYILIAAPFGIFLFLSILQWIRLPQFRTRHIALTAVVAAGIIVGLGQKPWKHPNFFTKNDSDRTAYYTVEAYMSQVEHPRLMTTVNLPMFDVISEAVPASRYWILQTGATGDMHQLRNDDIRRQTADFIICADLPESCRPTPLMENSGYRLVYKDTIREVFRIPIPFYLYARNGLLLHEPKLPEISNSDIFFKRITRDKLLETKQEK